MNTKTLVGVLAALVVAAGAWYWSVGGVVPVPAGGDANTTPAQGTMGTYPYECDNGAAMTMTPSGDASTVVVAPNGVASQGKIPAATLRAQPFDGGPATYTGQGITFVGAGEEITLTFGGQTVHCNPVPNPDEAPFNWGDAGDGGGH